jgi:hypothetical protein
MPSKKKKKGPKRKKAKADKKDGGEDKEAVTVAAVDLQMQRLKIDEAALDDDDIFLEEASNLPRLKKRS